MLGCLMPSETLLARTAFQSLAVFVPIRVSKYVERLRRGPVQVFKVLKRGLVQELCAFVRIQELHGGPAIIFDDIALALKNFTLSKR